MRFTKDPTGRLPIRIFFTEEELESQAEKTERLGESLRCGSALAFKSLKLIAERIAEVEEADLPSWREGSTTFSPGKRPVIRMSTRDLFSNRAKMTLAHEIGHVVLHTSLFEALASQSSLGFAESDFRQDGSESDLSNSHAFDWLEWQASYFAGALLMRKDLFLKRLIPDHLCFAPLLRGAESTERLLRMVAREFEVSAEACRVRAEQLKLITDKILQTSLFDEPT